MNNITRLTTSPVAVQAFPLSDVKAYMGHADISTTMIYVHHVAQHDAAERLGRVVSGTSDYLGEERQAADPVERCRPSGET